MLRRALRRGHDRHDRKRELERRLGEHQREREWLGEQAADDQSSGAAHGHFGACGEWAQNTCPNWGSTQDVIVGCLQAMWDEGPGEPFEEHGHYINMSSTDYSKVACGFSQTGQGVWANQNFTP